jgi:hypothetical protein
MCHEAFTGALSKQLTEVNVHFVMSVYLCVLTEVRRLLDDFFCETSYLVLLIKLTDTLTLQVKWDKITEFHGAGSVTLRTFPKLFGVMLTY